MDTDKGWLSEGNSIEGSLYWSPEIS